MRIPIMKMKFLVLAFFILSVNGQDTDQVEETTVDLCGNGTEESCDAFNSTELPTETTTVEVTSVVSKKATTKKPKTTTAKPTKKTSAQNGSSPLQPQSECICDLTRGDCEVNCCCDVDCSESQRSVFARCAAPGAAAMDYCIPPQLLYRNNTDYQAVMTDGMLCVVRQNTHVSTDFKDVEVVRTLTALKTKLEKHKHYSWTDPRPTLPVFDPDIPYKDGSPVWISDNITITHLALPASGGYSTQCVSSLFLKYLVDVDTSCTVPLQNKADCLTSSYTNFSVISTPRNFNFTGPQECTDDVCLPIRQFVCSKTCVEGRIPPSSFNNSNQTCLNTVISVEYKVFHNGTQGIVEVKAFYTLGNLSVQEDQLVRKHYRVTYKWAGSNGEETLKRSGHPGYERGRPIISGRKSAKTVVLNISETEWISFPVAGPSGVCRSRHNLMFRGNVKSQCVVKVSGGTCKQMQQQLWQQMLGPGGNISEMVISAYGDPRVGDKEGWVPLLTSDLPPPPSLVSAIDIVMLHTLVGPVARPQAKIIGTFLRVLPSEVACASNLTQVMVKVSVKFVDKTVAPVTKFAPPPVYEIKLPQDFFYPFLSSAGNVCLAKPVVFSVLVTMFSRVAIDIGLV